MTCLCDIEIYKNLLEVDQIEIEEIDESFNDTIDIVFNITENEDIDGDDLFPQPIS